MNLCTLFCVFFFFSPLPFPVAKSCIPIVQKIGNRFVLLDFVGPLSGKLGGEGGDSLQPSTFFPLIRIYTRQKSDSETLKQ